MTNEEIDTFTIDLIKRFVKVIADCANETNNEAPRNSIFIACAAILVSGLISVEDDEARANFRKQINGILDKADNPPTDLSLKLF